MKNILSISLVNEVVLTPYAGEATEAQKAALGTSYKLPEVDCGPEPRPLTSWNSKYSFFPAVPLNLRTEKAPKVSSYLFLLHNIRYPE